MQFNLPTTCVRDLNVHGNDLVVATYGRGLLILDDLTPLRQIGPRMTGNDTALKNDLERWRKINVETLPAVNQILKQNKIVPLPIVTVDKDPKCLN